MDKKIKKGKLKKHNHAKKIDTYTHVESDGQPIILCRTRRNFHQIDPSYIVPFLNARVDEGKTMLEDNKVYIQCGKNTTKNVCERWIELDYICSVTPKGIISDELINKITIKVYEKEGLFTYCPNVKCFGSNGFKLDSNDIQMARCPIKGCTMTWCIKCKVSPYHKDISCIQAKLVGKDDPDSKYLIDNAQMCPKCERAVQKEEGCDHMKCLCGTYFCYVCGEVLDKTYRKHLVYDEKYDTYVCPKRLNRNKSKLANSKIVQPVPPPLGAFEEELIRAILEFTDSEFEDL